MTQKLSYQQQQIRFRQAKSLHQAGKVAQAKAMYQQLLTTQPGNAELLKLLGIAEYQFGNLEESARLLGKSLQISPRQPDTLYNRANALTSLQRFEEALASYNKAVALKPDFVEAYFNWGILLQKLKRHQEALTCYDKVLAIRSDYAEAYNNRGNVLKDLQRFEEALASYDKAIALKPDYGMAIDNRGNILQKLNRFEEALASYDRLLAIRPDYAEGYNHRGVTLQQLRRFDESLVSYDKAIAVKTDFAEAFYNRGTTLIGLQRLEEALASYSRALEIEPDYEFLAGSVLHTMKHMCCWHQVEEKIASLVRNISADKKVSLPYVVLSLVDSGSIQRKCSEIFTAEMFHSSSHPAPIAKLPRHQKIRIGYFSADFNNHPVLQLAAEMFELHDRNLFETIAFSFGPETKDIWQQRAIKAFDNFIDVRYMSDQEVALLARKLEIDIAIDLSGHTRGSRAGIFSERAAPLQVNYLGYPGTIGAWFVDYIIADTMLIPEDQQKYYSEKIVYLPDCYMPICKKRDISEELLRREDHGMPADAFVFSSFNNNYKITPAIFEGWMRILQKVEGSILWLMTSNQVAENNLRKEAAARGISASRLIFAQRIPGEQYLNRLRLADLMLDTFPFCAHTTCSDALRMGLPVITRTGESFASRAAASLIFTVGLPELITKTQEEYESLAIELATHPAKLSQIKAKLNSNVKTSPLFDSERYTRNIESAYIAMYERYQNDLPPENIFIRSNTEALHRK